MLLQDIMRQAGIALEEDYAQMKLMDKLQQRKTLIYLPDEIGRVG